ncbi:hypothetical protein L3Y34_008985 [Caenorhabditis briggsae]|uniref:Uncharacterized protein n=1 Tax=Caenorhabditis briggsae TaxID=6238 RepID=A0AAE9A4M2_CAEBR|nr:hypothetical protein L3Y34_008985 [Caenorhabditis briggsae]
MKKFLLTLDFQKSFIHALENDSMKNWYQNNEKTLAKISECLETIEVPKTDKKEEEISKLIKNSFLLLFRSFWEPGVFQLKKRSKLKTLGRRLNPKQDIRKIEIEEFKRIFMKSVESKKWSNFYSSYSSYFDNVIRLARNQEKLDIVVETENKNQYNTLTDAKAHTHQVNLAKEGNMKDQKKKKSKLASQPLTLREYDLLESPKIERDVPVKRSSSEASSASLSFSAKINERNEEFQRELNAQNEKFAEELRKMREKRERLNREAEEDMRQFKKSQLNSIVSSPLDSRNSKSTQIRKEPLPKAGNVETPGIHRTPSQASNNSLHWENRRNQMDLSFQRKLNEQNEEFAEELRKMREKRERLNREAEEDMRKFRKESAMRIQMFLNCIQLRIRWEEQEQEWGDWLKSLRTPVARVKTILLEFEYQRRHNDEEENKSDIMYLQKSIQIAYEKLTYEFENLYFISHLATKLCVTMEELDEYEPNEEFFNKINEMSKNIDAMDIPTTSKLRLICSNASPDDYEHIDPPKVPNYACVITEVSFEKGI